MSMYNISMDNYVHVQHKHGQLCLCTINIPLEKKSQTCMLGSVVSLDWRLQYLSVVSLDWRVVSLDWRLQYLSVVSLDWRVVSLDWRLQYLLKDAMSSC
jgi:hypothetical protein